LFRTQTGSQVKIPSEIIKTENAVKKTTNVKQETCTEIPENGYVFSNYFDN
jgi:hypothetical protein